jgi:hypothetical protein
MSLIVEWMGESDVMMSLLVWVRWLLLDVTDSEVDE